MSFRSGNGPELIEFCTYRFRGHSMSDPANYRSRRKIIKSATCDMVTAFPYFCLICLSLKKTSDLAFGRWYLMLFRPILLVIPENFRQRFPISGEVNTALVEGRASASYHGFTRSCSCQLVVQLQH